MDNTFSPMIISPAKWGADVVVHSMTKFISGASDIIAGAAATDQLSPHMSTYGQACCNACAWMTMLRCVAGAICGRGDFIRSLMDLHLGPIMLLGPTIDPKIASELSLRIPHLGIRMVCLAGTPFWL